MIKNLLESLPRLAQAAGWLVSLCIVALGQPARLGWLGAVAGVFGFALFFLSLSKNLSPKRKFAAGTLWFAVVQAIQLSWMTSIEFQGYYILVVYGVLAMAVGAQFGLLTLLVPLEKKLSIPNVLFLSSLWTLLEWSRLFFLCGFTWNPAGLSLTHFVPSLQFAALFGIFGLTFWVMLTNFATLRVIREGLSLRRSCGVCLLVAIPYLYGYVHLRVHSIDSEGPGNSMSVALVQTSLLPSQKIPHPGRAEEFISPFLQWKQIVKALHKEGRTHWDMIVLPEAAVPLPSHSPLYPFEAVHRILVQELGVEVEKSYPALAPPFAEGRSGEQMCVSNLFWCQVLSNYFDSEVVAGLDHCDAEAGKNYNSAFYFVPSNGALQRYDKQVLLPLAEYLPSHWLKPLSKSYGITDFFTQGSGAKVFGGKIPFSPSICYEETFPEMMREGRSKGAQLFVNLTNDNYYPHSSLHRQHLFHARVRAVENGVPLIRSCNAGISAVVDCFGRVLQSLEESPDAAKEKNNLLAGSFSPQTLPTLYAVWGEGGVVFCAG